MPPRICPFQASVDDDRGEEMRAAFKIFDKNRDGFITRSELKVSGDGGRGQEGTPNFHLAII